MNAKPRTFHDCHSHLSARGSRAAGANVDAYRIFIAGFGIAAWAPLVPYAKARAQLNEGTLGLLLLCLGVGSIIAMPAAGAWPHVTAAGVY